MTHSVSESITFLKGQIKTKHKFKWQWYFTMAVAPHKRTMCPVTSQKLHSNGCRNTTKGPRHHPNPQRAQIPSCSMCRKSQNKSESQRLHPKPAGRKQLDGEAQCQMTPPRSHVNVSTDWRCLGGVKKYLGIFDSD